MYCWMGVFRLHTRASTPLLAPSHLTEDRRWHGYQTIKSFNFKRSTPLTHFFCCCFFLHKHRREPSTRLFDVSWGKKKHTQTHTVGPSGLVSAVKALLSHRLMCFGFSTSCKWKQSAHIQDNQKIFKRKKVTHNSTKASQTCSGRAWRRSCQRRYQLPEQGGGREGDGALAGGAKLPDKTT